MVVDVIVDISTIHNWK